MAVLSLDIRSRSVFAKGASFGDTGPYERLDGLITFAVDPSHPSNQAIVDLDKAARDADGRVRFAADFCLLTPVDPARSNRRLLFDVLNRGRKTVPGQFNRAARTLEPTAEIDSGDGFLMRRGWSVAWCGWQWDVVRSPALMGLEAPLAVENGRPLRGRLMVEFQPNQRLADHLLADRIHQPYPAADLEEAAATLAVRDWYDGPRTAIPRDQWRFARDESGTAVPDATRVWLAGGFEPGRIYEVVYTTNTSPVAGAGLLAVRDCVSFLRYDQGDNPCAGAIDHTFGFGASQSGRFLRHFLYLGLNVDEQGRQVFDGLIPHIAGARRGEFNHRFAQPSVQYSYSFGHLFPFHADDMTDLVNGRTDGLLSRQRALGSVPKIVAANTAAEYWRGDASLLHTDPAGERDVEPPAEMRVYLFAGTQHTAGALPLTRVSPLDGAPGAHFFNTVDYVPLSRASLENLDRWVTEGIEPPPSVFPHLVDGTAAPVADVLQAFRAIPGATVPDPERIRQIRRLDLGPEADTGVGAYPPAWGEPYRTYVAAVDEDRNELGGIRLPDLTVPLATYTGWNPRATESGGDGQIMAMLGSTLPFSATPADRARTGDPRASIGERYRDKEAYLARVRAAAQELVTQRYLLPEDLDLVVQTAARRYDAFAPAPVVAAGVGEGEVRQ